MRDLALEQELADLLLSLKLTVAVAESCTGGLISHRLTNISGSSGYYEMGVVSYSNRSKVALLAVPDSILNAHGAVSKACVVAMASGVKNLAGTDLGLAVSGIAGPTGGTAQKPVGTVHMALAGPKEVQYWRLFFEGTRQEIKARTSEEALLRLRDYCRVRKNG